jgi:hypothetical protein
LLEAGKICDAGLRRVFWLALPTGSTKRSLFEPNGAKTFGYSGPWALSPKTPVAQINKVFLLLFVHKK